ncbi:MAG: Holliday junction branch migration DNA helicase RuvB [Elusimicrobia bacterium]|nr:Holliday junction branch migration DNA helicase RuvB [Elusimicrobiota bacterium]
MSKDKTQKIAKEPDSKTQAPENLESLLRPKTLPEFIGQPQLKENFSIYIQAAKKRSEPLDHALFYAPPGLGKTTLAHILAREMGVNIRVTSGPILTKLGDLAGILTTLEEGDVLFIDEIHRLSRVIEEALYPVMEDFTFYIHTGPRTGALGSAQLKLAIPRFTLIGATTRAGMLTGPLRDRFGIIGHLNFYGIEEMRQIVVRSARILDMQLAPESAQVLAARSRRTPRVANRILRRVRDFASVLGDGTVTSQLAEEALKRMEIDNLGLDPMDRKFLLIIIQNFDGGPVGIETLAASLQEEADTITDIFEPYLIQEGFLARTSKGRVATRKAYEHLGCKRRDQASPIKTAETLFS